jgi:curved DNA-binding protein CbpA
LSSEATDQVGENAEQSPAPIDIPEALQARIRGLARDLPDMTYHELLGVHVEARPEDIRRGFFEMSKTFHPDRYFKRELGAYQPLIHEIYKRVVAAHEVLRDEKLRADYERTLKEKPSFRIGPPRNLLGLPGARKPKTEGGRSLREREGLRSKHTILMDLQQRLETSRHKGRKHFDDAMRELESGDLIRAASLIRLALAYDPREPEYHQAMAEILPQANAEQAETARAKGEMLLRRDDVEGAIEFLEQAIQLAPMDSALAHELAGLQLGRGEVERAGELARMAVELDEKNAAYRKTFGLILKEQGDLTEARKELTRAWELDPMDRDVKEALSVL